AQRVVVAGLHLSLVAARGSECGIVEQEADDATTNGTILPYDTTAYTLSSEASGRQAVRLTPGQYVAFTLTQRANAVTIRYAIPDAPTGGGIDAPLTVSVERNGSPNTHPQTITLTSKYSWLYNQYPFTNDPNAGLLHPDWWITECSCVPDQTTLGSARYGWTPPAPPLHQCPERVVEVERAVAGHGVLQVPG